MRGDNYTVERLKKDVFRFGATPEKARKSIEEVRDMFNLLLNPKITDATRCRLVNKIQRRMNWGYGRIEDYASLSKIACDPEYPAMREKRDAEAKVAHEVELEKSRREWAGYQKRKGESGGGVV